jgi:dephospho-CoA kinase
VDSGKKAAIQADAYSIASMLLVGLTGGIGAGKSTVAGMLAERGAVVIDADDLARKAVDPGTPGFDAVLETFGRDVVSKDGSLDRGRLAALVFKGEEARRKLEAIVHPEVRRLFVEEAGKYQGTDRILVYTVPLLVESGLQGMFDVVVVVTAKRGTRLARLAAAREMSADNAKGRMDAQLPDEEREAAADVVIRNDGSMEDLERQVDAVWRDLMARIKA